MYFPIKHTTFARLYRNFVISLKEQVIFSPFSSDCFDFSCSQIRILTVNSRESLELGRCFLSSIWKETKVMHVFQWRFSFNEISSYPILHWTLGIIQFRYTQKYLLYYTTVGYILPLSDRISWRPVYLTCLLIIYCFYNPEWFEVQWWLKLPTFLNYSHFITLCAYRIY